MIEQSDQSVLARAKTGDSEALEKLLQSIQEHLRRVAKRRMGERLRAHVQPSDLLQSTYIDVLSAIGRFRGKTEEDFTNWAVRVLENNIKDAAKFFYAEKRAARKGSSDVDVADISVSGQRLTPSAEVSGAEERGLIGRAMQRIPKDYRRILSLQIRGARDHKSLARAMNRSEGASRVLLARARAALLIEIRKIRGQAS